MSVVFYVLVFYQCGLLISATASIPALRADNQCDETSCSTNVTTPWNDQRPIQCKIQEQECMGNLSSPNNPSAPKSKTGMGWYLYQDVNNETKIALNVSWGPQHDASINFLRGYLVDIFHNKIFYCSYYFCFNHTLNEIFKWATFTFPCAPFSSVCHTEIVPGSTLRFEIKSLPLSQLNSDFIQLIMEVQIPRCNDTRMKSHPKCAKPKFSVQPVDCKNKSIILSYTIPPIFTIGWMKICLYGGPIKKCQKVISTLRNVRERNQLKISEEQFNETANYTLVALLINGDVPTLKSEPFNFHHCQVVPAFSKPFDMMPIIISVSIIVSIFLVGCITVAFIYKESIGSGIKKYCCCFSNQNSGTQKPKNKEQRISQLNTISEQQNETLLKVPFKPVPLSSPVVFVVFVDDHPQHRDVILKFSAFLCHDLGFEVLCELFEQNVIYNDYCLWMETSMAKADKIIVVWSEGAVNRWNQSENQSGSVSFDLFSPVLSKIKKDLFCDKNIRKYYFTYFEYFDEGKIPKAFRNLTCCHFRLMKQFEELYFQLKDTEMYSPDKILREEKVAFDSYFEAELNKYGPALLKSITDMCIYTKHHPHWFTDNNGVEEALGGHSAPQTLSIIENKLKIIPPMPIQPPVAQPPQRIKETHFIDNKPMTLDLSPVYPAPKITHPSKVLYVPIEQLPSRVPCENDVADCTPTDDSESQNESNFSSFQLDHEPLTVDSGYSTQSPQFHTPGYAFSFSMNERDPKYECHSPPTSFNFSDDDSSVAPKDNIAPDFVPKLAALDSHTDPWISLASINKL
uniref:interleukin-17 receptor A n=1 Tax=Ciona intestinalis TaxID=7719 RepID=UPI000180C5E5|nr:interleukin-17 receptor A [Ciona intestinalis]|eukprot:XP_026694337.1 interleukin-17 receptor A [Ciona intestinalis]